MTPAIRPRRSALYLPASNARALDKARTLPADVVILDLEDAVAPETKDAARDAAVAAVRAGGFGTRELVVRANALDTPWGAHDLAALVAAAPDAVLLPKVSSAADIADADAALASAPPQTALWVMIETCRAVLALDAIAACAPHGRLAGFVLGTNDLAKEMRAPLAPGRAVLMPLIAQAVVAARAYGLIVLDGVLNDFSDEARLRNECAQGVAYGVDGKTLIHPRQIGPCNDAFSPAPPALAEADRIIAAFAHPEHAGKGAIKLDGRMVELLHLDEARRLRATADKIAMASRDHIDLTGSS